jgi:hypothetical protein
MHSNSLHLIAMTSALLPLSNGMLTPNDIPDEWKSSMAQTWDNTVIRFKQLNSDLETYHNWALDQIIDGDG